jgi:hypothetical protein
MQTEPLRLVIFQETPGFWTVHGLEHDIMAEGHTIGEALRAVVRSIEAHTLFDLRHSHRPLTAFPPAPQSFWNAYRAGTAVPLQQLGVTSPEQWAISIAMAAAPPAIMLPSVRMAACS